MPGLISPVSPRFFSGKGPAMRVRTVAIPMVCNRTLGRD